MVVTWKELRVRETNQYKQNFSSKTDLDNKNVITLNIN